MLNLSQSVEKESVAAAANKPKKRAWQPQPAKEILNRAGLKIGDIKKLTLKWNEMELPDTLKLVNTRMLRVFEISGTNKRLLVHYGGRVESISWEIV